MVKFFVESDDGVKNNEKLRFLILLRNLIECLLNFLWEVRYSTTVWMMDLKRITEYIVQTHKCASTEFGQFEFFIQ